MTTSAIVQQLKLLANKEVRQKMSYFGSKSDRALGITIPQLRSLAKTIGKNHYTALELWKTNIHEACILASMVDEIDKVTEQQMDAWVRDFDSWDMCDQVCQNLFVYSPFATKKIITWATKQEEFVKRAAFSLIAQVAIHTQKIAAEEIELFFTLIKKAATDERNFVKKSVNWALRQLGKKNLFLNKQALVVAREISSFDSKSAQWIAKDAIKELSSDAVLQRLHTKQYNNLKKINCC